MDEAERVPFVADWETWKLMNEGHINRKGHPIEGYWKITGIFKVLIRTCCGEEE